MPFECGYSWGDPHYVTADGLKYDMQGCGEFVLVETVDENDPDPVMVQTRTERVGGNLSINTAMATEVDGYNVTIDTKDAQPLTIVAPDGGEVSLPTDGASATDNCRSVAARTPSPMPTRSN